MRTEEQLHIQGILREWAAKKPLINKIFLYGSRIAGNNKPDSDLDIAIELDPKEFQDEDKSDGTATWIEVADGWKEELEGILDYAIHLEKLDTNSPTVQAGILVFVKIQSPSNP